jgi:putative FmdB family regulatory protein
MLFDYRCKECGEVVEIDKKIIDPHPTKCPKCDKDGLERYFASAPSVEYKGKGWMKTDGKY